MTLMMRGCFPETVNQFPACFNANLTIKEFHYLNKRWIKHKCLSEVGPWIVISQLGASQPLLQHIGSTSILFLTPGTLCSSFL